MDRGNTDIMGDDVLATAIMDNLLVVLLVVNDTSCNGFGGFMIFSLIYGLMLSFVFMPVYLPRMPAFMKFRQRCIVIPLAS